MYNPMSSCSALLHVLIRIPILIVALGLVGASAYVKGLINNNPKMPPAEIVEQENFRATVEKLSVGNDAKLAEASVPAFRAITKVESGLVISGSIEDFDFSGQPFNVGVHKDGVSFGPSGLTNIAVKDVKRKLPDCYDLGYDEILSDPKDSVYFANIYFLDQIHRFKSLDRAIVAYNNGPTRTMKAIKEKKRLPDGYLKKVKAEMKNQ